jgi:peptidoglycan/xylan/chitin deacetylase (PgdA/CDA1 family)
VRGGLGRALLAVGALAGCDGAVASEAPAPVASSSAGEAVGPAVATASAVESVAAMSAAPAGAPSAPAPPVLSATSDPLVITLHRQRIETDFSKRPFYFSAAFDGSLRYSLWLRALERGRAMKKKHGKTAHLTFFVNAAFYSTQPGPSDVGKAMSRAEVLARRALTQQAINEGHEIADHGVGHHDGRSFTKAEWLAEIDRFRGILGWQLYQPVNGDDGTPVFPRFAPLEGAAPGETGAACATGADCAGGSCLALTEEVRVCSQPCNLKAKCPPGTACGAPMFRQDTDVCVPAPLYPIELDGKVLFNERGEPNRKHPRLVPYAIVGYRAPYLAANDALYEALAERGYIYDTSQSASPGPPFYFIPRESPRKVLELALMLHPGAAAIPMDYNYAQLEIPGARMKSDYEAAILSSYAKGRVPWNVGHHFAMWEEGAYLDALEWTVDFVLGGCPDESGAARCEGGEVVSFRELAQRLE